MIVDDNPESVGFFKTHFAGCRHLACYCGSEKAAKSLMAGVYPDIVVSRLHFDNTSGKKLFLYVTEQYPNAIRIIFSDESEQQNLIRMVATGIAHRYFCMPWEKNGVGAILAHDLLTRSRLRVHNCWRYLKAENVMPAIPSVMREIEEVVQDDDFAMDKLVEVISKDPAIAAILLQVVNSAAFPKKAVIGDLHHAVTFLGISQTRELVLYVCARQILAPPRKCSELFRLVSTHSFLCSRLAGIIARQLMPGLEKAASTAALLHDIGKLIFFSVNCNRYLELLDFQAAFDQSSADCEIKEFGVSHSQLGSSLMLWWNLPMTMIESAANHNLALDKLSGIPRCVAIADRCLREVESNGEVITDLDTLRDEFPVDEWRTLAGELLASEGADIAV